MSRKTYRVIESPTGVGELRKAGEHLAGVSYRLQVRQEFMISESVSGQEEIPGIQEISGEVTVTEAERMQVQVLRSMSSGELLTLHLSDGRRLNVYATKGDPLSGTYRVVPGSPAGFVTG